MALDAASPRRRSIAVLGSGTKRMSSPGYPSLIPKTYSSTVVWPREARDTPMEK